MNPAATLDPARTTWPQRVPFYYGWISVAMASLAMTATLPGRTHGLGLITVPLLRDLGLGETLYAQLNLAASLLGAAFCLPCGWLIDRCGVRIVLTVNVALLAIVVFGMSAVTGAASLLVALVLIRGLGQSALSIVSMAMIGKWFRRRLGAAMGVFSVLLTFGFIGSILGMGAAVERAGWRAAWSGLALALLAFAPLGWLLVRDTPEACGIPADAEAAGEAGSSDNDRTLLEALATPAFWVFVLGTSMFNLVWSAIMLFNESILAEKGFGQKTSVEIMAILTGTGLLANLAAGAMATRARLGWLLGVGLGILCGGLTAFPQIRSLTDIRLYAAAMGITGGIVTVIFFSAWGHLFGRSHLGRIQGAAQLVSVFASAVGPLLMAWGHDRTGSYSATFFGLAAAVGALAVAAIIVPLPRTTVDSPAATPAATMRESPQAAALGALGPGECD